MTKHYTDAERAAVVAESRRILEQGDAPQRRPAPEPPPPREVRVPEIDPVQEWREWHDARDREREANRAELRRHERDAEHAASAIARIIALERRVAEAEQASAQADAMVRDLAAGTVEFSDKVLQALDRLDGLAAQLNTKMVELRALDDVRRGEIIDMPSPLIRKERVN